MKKIILSLAVFASLTGCVSSKKHKAQFAELSALRTEHEQTSTQLRDCNTARESLSSRNRALEEELTNMKNSNNNLLNQLTNMSVLTKAQSESIKKSLENISSKDAYIKDLNRSIQQKDSLNLALVMNLKGALKDVNDQDVEVKVEGSAVFISISDKMLFKSGSYEITPRAKEVLGKVATVIKAQPSMQFMVEGHTDNNPIKTASIKDNWDLSVLRATAVVRVLQDSYGIDPGKMIAAGRGEYRPVVGNNNAENKSRNRRTRIVILPELDQFFKMMEPQQQQQQKK